MPEALKPTKPRPSATVVLLRDTSEGPEVLLMLRHAKASFASSYVFPGGLNEPSDSEVHANCHGLTDAEASLRLQVAEGGLNYYIAAIRELFEESGILLAHREAGDAEFVKVADNHCDAQRELLNNGGMHWPDFVREQKLSLSCGALSYFAYWVTPRAMKKRFTTRFFMAALPRGQEACHDGGELTDSCWMRPAAALASAKSKLMTLPPPTRATLAELTQFSSVQDALNWAKKKEQLGVECTLPAIVGARDEQRIVMPGNPDYPVDHRGMQA